MRNAAAVDALEARARAARVLRDLGLSALPVGAPHRHRAGGRARLPFTESDPAVVEAPH